MKQKSDAVTNIGDRIRDALVMRGMTQTQLADRANLTDSQISHIINGRRHDIKISTLVRIANELHVPFDYLLSGDVRIDDREIRAITAAYKGAADDDKRAIRSILHKYDDSIKV
jgi:transcriptional regulator with XRE-family HTH domain